MSICPLGQMVDNSCPPLRPALAIAIANQCDKSWKTKQPLRGGGGVVQVFGFNFCFVLIVVVVAWAKCLCAAVRDCHRVANKMKRDFGAAKLFNITLSGIIIMHCATAAWVSHCWAPRQAKERPQCAVRQLWKITCNLVYQFVKIIKNMHTLNILAKSFVTQQSPTLRLRRCGNAALPFTTPLSGPRIAWVAAAQAPK